MFTTPWRKLPSLFLQTQNDFGKRISESSSSFPAFLIRLLPNPLSDGDDRRRHFHGSCLGLVGDQLAQERISTTSAIPTTRLPTPSSANSFAYPALVATAVVPVGSGIMPEKSPAKSDARPVTSIQLPIITPWYCRGASLPIIAYPMGEMSSSPTLCST